VQSDHPSSDLDGALDQLLSEARWPELSTEATARLRQTLITTPRPLRIPWQTASVAAGVALVIGAGAWFLRTRPVTTRSTQLATAVTNITPAVWQVPVRPATSFERLMLMASTKPARRPLVTTPSRSLQPVVAAAPVASNRLPASADALRTSIQRSLASREVVDGSLVDDFAALAGTSDLPILRQLLSQPAIEAAVYSRLLARDDKQSIDLILSLILDSSTRNGALGALRTAQRPPVDRLLAQLNAPLVDRRLAAARALGSLCHGSTLDLLKQMIARDDHRREALAALISCESPSAGEYLSALREQPLMRAQLSAVQTEMKSLF
jgi:hypothetical protein